MDSATVAPPPIRELRAAVDAMGTIDPTELSDTQLADELLRFRREIDRQEAVFSGLALAAHRRGVGGVDGYQSTAAWLRWQAGMRVADVRGAIDAGEVAELLPRTAAAWRAGTITSGAMRAITLARVGGADAELQAVEPKFLDAAKRKDLWSLHRMTAHFRSCAKRDGKLPADKSGLRAAVVGDRLMLDGEISVLAAETIQRALDAFTDAPSPDDARTPAQRRADALYRICRIALDVGVDASMGSLSAAIVIDWPTLLEHLSRRQAARDAGGSADGPSAAPTVDLTGRMDGGFVVPIDPAEIEALLCDCSISRVVTGPSSEPIDVGRANRAFSTAARRAIVVRDQHCRWPGCEKPPGWCEAHHVEHWEHGGESNVGNGVLLCSRHHHFLHQHDTWQIEWDQTIFRVYRPDGTELRPWIDDAYDHWSALAGP
jgi:Domain of unknown function DUF222./HNH endonuclease.